MVYPEPRTAVATGERGDYRPCSRREGFTLLELLISLTLLGVIVVIIMGAMRLGSRSVAAGEKKVDDRERFRAVLALVDAQIQSQLPLTTEEEGRKGYTFRGDGKNLRFSTGHSLWSGRRGYVIVNYRVEADGSGGEVLAASEQTPGIDGLAGTPLIEAKEISFDYFYRDSSDGQGGWQDTVLAGSRLPEKIRLHLVRGGERLAWIFPVRIQPGILPVGGGRTP